MRGCCSLFAAACALGFAVTFLVALHSARGLRLDPDALPSRERQRVPAGEGRRRARAANDRHRFDRGGSCWRSLAVGALARSRRPRRRGGRDRRAVRGLGRALKHGLPHLPPAFRRVVRRRFRAATRASPCPSASRSCSRCRRSCARAPPSSALRTRPGSGSRSSSLGWHYPSDVAASFFICGFWSCAIVGLFPGGEERAARCTSSGSSSRCVVVAGALVAAAAIASRHPGRGRGGAFEPLASSGLATLLGCLSVALFGAFTLLVEEPAD